MSFETKKPPITVNLQRDPATNKKIVQASLVDKRAAEMAAQRRAAEERLKQEKVMEQQRQEQLKREAELAQQAAELAKLQAAQQAKLEQQQAQIKKQVAEQQAALRAQVKKQLAQQQAQKQEQLAKQQEIQNQQMLAKKQAAAKQAALKSKHDRMLADQQALLETEVEKYRAEFAAAIEENRILSSVFAENIHCKLRIMLLPDGSIASVKVLESSGNPAYDQISASAVYKSAPFEMPQDQELYAQLREIVLSFKNGE